jgi:hypothetical protein
MTTFAQPNPMSRVLSVPVTFWQEERTLTLFPGETKSFNITTKTKLPANRMITVRLQEVSPDGSKMTSSTPMVGRPIPFVPRSGENLPGPVMLTFSTATNAPTPRLASVK